jgi:very-short-patch-repair endonuclease
VAALAATRWGVVSLAQLRACGLSRDAVATRVRNGRLHPLHRGVYALGHPAVPLAGRFLAAVTACGPTAVLSHFSAAAHYGFLGWDERYPEVTIRGTAPRHHAGIRVHRTRIRQPDDVARRGPLRLTSPARTLLDLAAALDERALRRAVREAQSLGCVSTREILATLDRLGSRSGAPRLSALVRQGDAPTRSELEDVVLDLIAGGGLEHPQVNRPLWLAGRRVVPDFRWPEQRLIVEADGAAWHNGRLARGDDAGRQALLEAHGERVVRVTWDQAVGARAQTLARLRAAGAPAQPRA